VIYKRLASDSLRKTTVVLKDALKMPSKTTVVGLHHLLSAVLTLFSICGRNNLAEKRFLMLGKPKLLNAQM
jgi:hypothetical protein